MGASIMPHAAIKLVGGANTAETPALNENSGISQTQLVRYFYSPNGESLVSKIGGWTRFYALPMVATVRALWAWEDLNDQSHLAMGTETVASTGSAQLAVITQGALDDITPTALTDNVTPLASATSGSAIIQITDSTTPGITNYNSVYIATQIAIGGIVLFGLYACDPDGFLGVDAYTVESIDLLGNPLPATSILHQRSAAIVHDCLRFYDCDGESACLYLRGRGHLPGAGAHHGRRGDLLR